VSPVSEAPSPGHGWILTTGPQEEKDLFNGLVGMMSEGMERWRVSIWRMGFAILVSLVVVVVYSTIKCELKVVFVVVVSVGHRSGVGVSNRVGGS
jgi:hypothetical protein